MLDSPHVRSQIVRSTCYVQSLGADGTALAYGTGCLVEIESKSILITCWHLLTGIDFLSRRSPNSMVPPPRRSIRVGVQDIYMHRSSDGAVSLISKGEAAEIIVDLYDGDEGTFLPRWIQAPSLAEPHRPELGNVRIPDHVDIAAIEVPLTDFQREHLCLRSEYFKNAVPYQGHPVSIIGYPNGLSLGGPGSAQPIWLTRFVASMWGDRRGRGFERLLDGACFPGMSGSPVVYVAENQIWVIGFYTGSLVMSPASHIDGRVETAQQLGLFVGVETVSATLQLPLTD